MILILYLIDFETAQVQTQFNKLRAHDWANSFFLLDSHWVEDMNAHDNHHADCLEFCLSRVLLIAIWWIVWYDNNYDTAISKTSIIVWKAHIKLNWTKNFYVECCALYEHRIIL